jgi:ankyrin repeat protein
MSRTLTLKSTLETLKKEAKRWLKALEAGDAKAQARFRAATPRAPAAPGLRDVQLALAREYGLPGWAALRQALDELAMARQSHAERVEIVLRAVMWQGDRVTAARIIARWPEIATDNLYTVVSTGNLDELKRSLAADPAAATRKGGPLDWEPLLYLAYSRLPGSESGGVEMARLLLDHGADPNARWAGSWGLPFFTVLAGVIGEGEGSQPPHPQALEFASLLLERGADPFDRQALYNTAITNDDTTWLDILWTASARLGQLEAWREVPDDGVRIGGAIPASALDFVLGAAVSYHHMKRAEWALMHGANANACHAYSQRLMIEEALNYGYAGMADLLVRHGADVPPLTAETQFRSAVMRLDSEQAKALIDRDPERLRDAWLMLTAAEAGRKEVVELLLKLGMNVDLADDTEMRAVHAAVRGNAIDVVKLLIEHGTDIDTPTKHYGGAVGFAGHFGYRDIAELLAPLSQDVWNLTFLGMTDRLEQVFKTDPPRVNAVHPRGGATPLHCLPDDEDEAVEIAEFLLARGADPGRKNKDGQTPEQAARKRGLFDAADLLAGAKQKG